MMSNPAGKEVTAAIDNLLDEVERSGRNLFWGDDGSRQLLVDNAAGLAGLNVNKRVEN